MSMLDEILREARSRDINEVLIEPDDFPTGRVSHSWVRLTQPKFTAGDFHAAVREILDDIEWPKYQESRRFQVEKWLDSVGPANFESHIERGRPVLRVTLMGVGIT